MHGIQSTNSYLNRKDKDRIHKIKYVKDIILDLECHGPAGLIHIVILSNIIERPIKIWSANSNLYKTIGKRKTRQPIDIEYHAINSEQIGHWTLRGGKDPDNVIIDLNSCLFSVIGSQIGQDPLKLRKWTALKLKNHLQNLTKWIDKILQLKENDRIILMIGGARYIGTCASNAGLILDRSQNNHSHGSSSLGHPRGHASHPSRSEESVENYSMGAKRKTGFLSRADQDYVTHLALKTTIAQAAMERLNNGNMQEIVKISAAMLMNSRYELPKAKEWYNGVPISSEMDIRTVVLVLQHHHDQFTNPNADVFVLTCYPTI